MISANQVRINMEKLIVTLKEESADWKKKYDMEARLRIDEVEGLKKKYTVQLADIQDRHDDLLSKLKAMESQKNKLAQEIEIIVKQFESSQVIRRYTIQPCSFLVGFAFPIPGNGVPGVNLHPQTPWNSLGSPF